MEVAREDGATRRFDRTQYLGEWRTGERRTGEVTGQLQVIICDQLSQVLDRYLLRGLTIKGNCMMKAYSGEAF
ncbi:hypothetical protein AALO_G00057410 [Alosa alosa]|uniref:Uncharacterized protein n=1 Tax=Alosa alosa TaxID=278164 RepID=A0AAV6H5K3_9TELE|nr:hypothetical protein AALO_G00057410 [Alosa alosa]